MGVQGREVEKLGEDQRNESTNGVWIICSKNAVILYPIRGVRYMECLGRQPYIWGWRKKVTSNKRATFPQFKQFIHSFQQVIHIKRLNRKQGLSQRA
jgi:hypothetical protein